jgi:2,3-bisphosphoglycerate-dependent phosphoglycerate mutase
MAHTLILLRHGQSQWNQENRFTGWADVDLTENGRDEVRQAARLLAGEGLAFDIAFTSLLKRAIRSLWIVMDGMDRMWVPVRRSWQLNERHYGALQGLNKAATVASHGAEQVQAWRRGFRVRPPTVDRSDERHPANDARYRDIPAARRTIGESLEDTLHRVEHHWQKHVAPELRAGRAVLIVAHGNSLRALIGMLDGLSGEDSLKLTIPTGAPLVYELDNGLRALGRRSLGNFEAWERPDRIAADPARR